MITLIPSVIVLMILQLMSVLKIVFMFLTSVKKPGYLDLNMDTEDNISLLSMEKREKQKAGIICRDCNSRKPLRTFHCSVCYRCVIRYDHHSYLLNTCIGYDNQVFYFFFLVFSLLESYFCCFGIVRYLHFRELFPSRISLIWSVFCLFCIVISFIVVRNPTFATIFTNRLSKCSTLFLFQNVLLTMC